MKSIIMFIIALGPMFAMAQTPKLHLKLFGGMNATTLVYRVENVDEDVLTGWQVGGGLRVTKRKSFFEIDFTYFEQGITLSPREEDELPIEDDVNITLRGFEVPLSIGYIPLRTPLFGVYLYGGLTNWFAFKGLVKYQGEEIEFKPDEVNLHFYNLGARFGAQIDLAMFNFDLTYSIGITNHFREKARTNSHTLGLNIGLLF